VQFNRLVNGLGARGLKFEVQDVVLGFEGVKARGGGGVERETLTGLRGGWGMF
jgi:hypothetical protein